MGSQAARLAGMCGQLRTSGYRWSLDIRISGFWMKRRLVLLLFIFRSAGAVMVVGGIAAMALREAGYFSAICANEESLLSD